MIDLTPLDVRKMKGDFSRVLRGYEPAVVDNFLDLVAERMEELVHETAGLRERLTVMSDQLEGFKQREQAMNEALVSAQQLREEVRAQAEREADLMRREAQAEGERSLADIRRQAEAASDGVRRIHATRARLLRGFRAFVERQMDELEAEEARLREALRDGRDEDGPLDAVGGQ